MWFHDHNCSFIFCLLHHGLCKKALSNLAKKSYTKTSCSSGWQRSSFRLVPTTTATTRATTWRLSTAMAWSTAETVERMRRTTTKNPSFKFGNAGWASMLPTDVTNTSLQHWKSSIQVDNMEQCLSGNTVKASWRWTLRKIIGKNTSDIGQHCIVWPQLLYNTYSAVQIIEPYPTAPSFSDWIVMTRATKLEKM